MSFPRRSRVFRSRAESIPPWDLTECMSLDASDSVLVRAAGLVRPRGAQEGMVLVRVVLDPSCSSVSLARHLRGAGVSEEAADFFQCLREILRRHAARFSGPCCPVPLGAVGFSGGCALLEHIRGLRDSMAKEWARLPTGLEGAVGVRRVLWEMLLQLLPDAYCFNCCRKLLLTIRGCGQVACCM